MKKIEVHVGLRVEIGLLGPLPVNTSLYYADNRRVGAVGTVRHEIPSTGSVVWWIEHDTGEEAPYSIHEFEPLPDQGKAG